MLSVCEVVRMCGPPWLLWFFQASLGWYLALHPSKDGQSGKLTRGGRKRHPFATGPVPDYRPCAPALTLPSARGTLAKVVGARPKARISAHLEASVFPSVEWAGVCRGGGGVTPWEEASSLRRAGRT